jgi:pyrroloquinoline quinone (PQQ) biosynthesis protein C
MLKDTLLKVKEIVLTHPAVTHKLFDLIHTGKLSKEGVQTFMRVHYPIVEPYSQYLLNILPNLNQREKLLLLVNINDEFGRGEITKCHNNMYKQLLDNFGGAPILNVQNQMYINVLTSLSTNKDTLLEAVSIAGMATETFTTPVFYKIREGLIKHYGYSTEDVEYFDMHIEVDSGHLDDIDTIIYSMHDRLNKVLFDDTLIEYTKLGLELRFNLWESIKQYLSDEDLRLLNE